MPVKKMYYDINVFVWNYICPLPTKVGNGLKSSEII